jgi:sarcosine oxidase
MIPELGKTVARWRERASVSEGRADAIVLGLGAMGAAATYQLARRGHRVLGFDAFARGHTNGSSHGPSRITRQAYYEAPEYVPLVRRACAHWRALEGEVGRMLLFVNRGLIVAYPDGRTVRGTIASALRHGLPYEELAPAEVAARFPGFRLFDELVAVFEPNAGFLAADACVAAVLDLAGRHGADCRHAEPVRQWRVDGAGVRVETDRAGRFPLPAAMAS